MSSDSPVLGSAGEHIPQAGVTLPGTFKLDLPTGRQATFDEYWKALQRGAPAALEELLKAGVSGTKAEPFSSEQRERLC